MVTDFPETRAKIAALRPWLDALVAICGTPRQREVPGGLRYEFEEQSPEVVQSAKAVRMVSGLNAAMHLADVGHTVEAAALLRMVTDFANEIIAVVEGLMRGELTAAQRKYVEDYFKPLPSSL